MPCVAAKAHHREKVVKVAKFINAMVSRPVGRAEMLSNTKAMDCMKKEWKGLIDQGVFDLCVIREYHDGAREAKQKNEEVHMAKRWRMIGWVGDSVKDMYLAVYAVSDFSGCADSLRSTSGGHMNLQLEVTGMCESFH